MLRWMPAAVAIVLAAAMPFTGAAQEAPRGLTVTGQGRVDLPPDQAMVMLGVTTQARTAAAALAANSAEQEKVLALLAAQGIEARDVQTTGLSLNPVWDYDRPASTGGPRITGYQASNMVNIRVRDLSSLGILLDKVVSTGANQLNGLSFGLSDPREAEDEARRRAVADALARARVLAEAAGLPLGPIMAITEGGAGYGPQPMFRAEASVEAPVPIAQGEVGVTASVTITFGLGQ